MILAILVGCDSPSPAAVPDDWQTIHARDVFTFKAPPDLKIEPGTGIDSFVGKYVSPTMEVTFDYGRYSNRLDDKSYTSRDVTVDGKPARLVSKGDMVGIHFPLDGKSMLTMIVRVKNSDTKTAEMLLQSIDFP